MKEYQCSYISASVPWSEHFPGVPILIRHVNTYLKQVWPAYIFSISMQEYMAGTQYHPSLFITYSPIDPEDRTHIDELKLQYDHNQSWEPDNFESTIIESKTGVISVVDIRLPKGAEQDNVPKLLDQVADYLDKKNIERPIAMTFDSTSDDDGIERPVVRVVYS